MRAVRGSLERRRARIETERQLQAALRGGGLTRARFRRDTRFGPYTLALTCEVINLTVVVNLHPAPAPTPPPDPDAERRKFLADRGLSVKRVRNTEVLDVSGVVAQLEAAIKDMPTSTGVPLDPAAVVATIMAEARQISGLVAGALDELRAASAGAAAALDVSGVLTKIVADIGKR